MRGESAGPGRQAGFSTCPVPLILGLGIEARPDPVTPVGPPALRNGSVCDVSPSPSSGECGCSSRLDNQGGRNLVDMGYVAGRLGGRRRGEQQAGRAEERSEGGSLAAVPAPLTPLLGLRAL